MKSCLKCGREYEDDFCFCPKCGSRLVKENLCPQCNKILEEDYAFCPYCGCAVNSNSNNTASSNSTHRVVRKETIKASSILYEMLVVGKNASVKNEFWRQFGYDGYPQYQSKWGILKDINNVGKNFFLIEEIICMSAGIGIHKFIETCCPDGADSSSCINGIVQLASNEPSFEKIFQLSRPDVKKRFDTIITDYVLAFAFEFSNMNNAKPEFTKIFMKHAQLCNVDIKGIYQGASFLAGYYLDYYRKRMKEFEEFDIANDL